MKNSEADFSALSMEDYKKLLAEVQLFLEEQEQPSFIRHWFQGNYGVWLVDENYELIEGQSYILEVPK